ncbi:MAG TPA: serine/threonine-protein kinase [Solirubrobacteraceae bacterium]|nr:serine/threonine-protein kinase [Solirubrobacteraceae bacterium]
MAATGELARYQYISTIGSGGMARVDLAEDTLLGRRVALKRMSGPADPRGLSRLRREALAGASLSHPNLVSIYDVVTTDEGHLVIVMEYIAGGTLRDALNRRDKLPVADALRVLEGVAAGLDAIHERGIVHRDVKPSNILLGDDGTVKVADLGIASVPDRTRITTAGSVLGSLSYMAPEQLEDSPSTPAIDIYALAAVAYEVLSGEKARGETNPVTLAHAISTQSPPNLRNAWPQAPAAAADLLVRAMSRYPADRPRSAGELVGRLRAALVPEPTAPVPPLAAAAPAEPQTRRHAVAAAAAPPRVVDAGTDRAAPREVAGRRSRAGALAAALLVVLAAVIVLAVLLNSSGSGSHAPPRTTASRRAHRPAAAGHTRRPAAASRAGTASTQAAGAADGGGATTPDSASTTSASVTSSPAASATPAPPAAATPAPQSAGSPVGAVEAFYGAAAAHRYASAWALADPALRSQLAGYRSFQAGQAGDRSITFNSAKVISRSSHAATVAVQTTSVRDNGIQHCSGTVDLVPGGAGDQWQLHQIHINCT